MSLKYKAKITIKTSKRPPQPGNEGDADRPAQPPVPSLNVEMTISVKNLSKSCRSLDLTFLDYGIELYLSWTKDVLIEHHNKITGVNLVITSIKIYVSLVNLKEQFFGINIDLKQQHNRNNNKLDYMIDPAFRNIGRLFVLSFKNVGNSFFKSYKLLVETKDFNASINNKPFFDQPIKKQTRSI